MGWAVGQKFEKFKTLNKALMAIQEFSDKIAKLEKLVETTPDPALSAKYVREIVALKALRKGLFESFGLSADLLQTSKFVVLLREAVQNSRIGAKLLGIGLRVGKALLVELTSPSAIIAQVQVVAGMIGLFLDKVPVFGSIPGGVIAGVIDVAASFTYPICYFLIGTNQQ